MPQFKTRAEASLFISKKLIDTLEIIFYIKTVSTNYVSFPAPLDLTTGILSKHSPHTVTFKFFPYEYIVQDKVITPNDSATMI